MPRLAVLMRRLSSIAAPDVSVSGTELERCWFYCGGEFGYEMVSWAPYLRYLHSIGVGPIQIVTRRGASVFYDFADQVMECEPDPQESGWTRFGHYRSIAKVVRRSHGGKLISPLNIRLNPVLGFTQEIRVSERLWEYRDIHAPFLGHNWCRLQPTPKALSEAEELIGSQPYVVVTNKRQLQWNQTNAFPLNSFNSDDLEVLCEAASSAGFRVLYNFFAERDHEHAHIFSTDPTAQRVDMWGAAPSISADCRNDLLISVLKSSSLHISVQGGACYLPAMLGIPQEVLMRQGDYVDYVTLSKITGNPVRCHYEVETMVPYIRRLASEANR